MDVTKAKDLQEAVGRWLKTGDMSLYREADERRMTVRDLLEERDPSERSPDGTIAAPLDAFERQMMLAGMRAAPGDSVTVDAFFNSPVAILAPEWFRRQIKVGMDMKPGADNLLAALKIQRPPNCVNPEIYSG